MLLENSGALYNSCFSLLKPVDLENPVKLALAGFRLNFLSALVAVIRKKLAIV